MTLQLEYNSSLPAQLLRLWGHLSRRRHWQYGLLLILMIVSALAEVISIGALLPFLSALAAPDKIFAQPLVQEIAAGIGIISADQLLKPLTIIFIVAAFVAGCIRLLLLWATTKLTFAAGADLSMDIYRRTLYQPYNIHIARNSSEIISGITTKNNSLMFDLLLPSLTIINSAVLLIFICSALLYVNPQVALVAAGGFGFCYILIAKLMHKKLRRNGQIIAKEQTGSVKALQEGLGGIRDVLLDNTQPLYCDIYRGSDLPLRKAQGLNLFISGCPRYAMESIGMVMVALIAYYLSYNDGIAAALPTLGALALGVQRLLPTLQQAYNSWSLIMGNGANLSDILHLLNQPLPEYAKIADRQKIDFNEQIELRNIKFHYSDKTPVILDIDNLVIPKGARVGVVGTTGSGKSTLLDIIMGLLSPASGKFLVDGLEINIENAVAWQRNIAHVPQNIFLSDASFADNIALGVPHEEIDMDKIKRAANQADIAGFIESKPEAYNGFVGERGVRLSGGQRQRIAIARALYKNAKLLVLDEATSALDNETEEQVMQSIEELNKDLTIIIVAHRLSTLKKCDFIIHLKDGKICQN